VFQHLEEHHEAYKHVEVAQGLMLISRREALGAQNHDYFENGTKNHMKGANESSYPSGDLYCMSDTT